MRILVVGSGAREHALVARLGAEPGVSAVLCAPGNPGMARTATCLPVSPTDIDGMVAAALGERIDLVVVGPEAPLALGLADRLREQGLAVFGPGRAAARLETSKAFAKRFMSRHDIPTARYVVCEDPGAARAAADDLGYPVVVKADGLAAGKGVTVASTREEAQAAIAALMVERVFGDAGATVVVEEHLPGTEASFFAVCDGRHAVAVGTAQDHKRVLDGDRGPNTGGMGAFAPSPLVDAGLHGLVMSRIVEPVLTGMREEDAPFVGCLYVGLMITATGPRVVEFNVRFGDPETQVVLPLVGGSMGDLLHRAATGRLAPGEVVPMRDGAAVGVVLASGGYPGPFERGHVITGLEHLEGWPDLQVLHAGTALRDGRLVTDGGRVLTLVATAPTLAAAVARAYEAVALVHFEGMHVRRDIGRRAIRSAG